jgi:O-acetylserine/cysteine efflux transporter
MRETGTTTRALAVSATDAALGVLVAVVWGVAFVATKIALGSFSPPELTLLRFVVAAAPVAVLGRPPVPWPALVAIGATIFAGQFLFQFFAIALGLPPGLAAVAVQTQALFTVLFAAVALGERPTPRQLLGMAAALLGLAAIALTIGRDLTAVGLGLGMLSAVSWGVGNVLMKRLPAVDTASLVAWLSLVPPLPALALSLALDGPSHLPRALASASWAGWGGVLYLGVVATIVGYAIWGSLLRRYPAATVAPFALLVPVVGAWASSLAFGETFGPMRLAGMALVLLGLAIIVLPGRTP